MVVISDRSDNTVSTSGKKSSRLSTEQLGKRVLYEQVTGVKVTPGPHVFVHRAQVRQNGETALV
jgi:hypothetical protein